MTFPSPLLGRRRGLLAVICLAAACQRSSDVDTQLPDRFPYAGAFVRILLPAELGIPKQWEAAFNDWAEESGADFELVEIDQTALTEGNLAETIAAQQPTLVLLPSPLINLLIADELVAPIPESILAEDVIAWSDMSPSVCQALGSLSNVPSMVPVTTAMPICCYRADLLEAAGRAIPTTWEQYDELAATLPEWAPGHVAVEPWGERYRSTTFLSRALSAAKHPAQYSVELDVATGEPLIALPPFVRALEEVVSLKPHLAENADVMSPRDCFRELQAGRAAMGIVWETLSRSVGNRSVADEAASGQNAAPRALTFTPLPGRREVYDRDSGEWVAPPAADQNRPALCGSEGLTVCVLTTAPEREQAAAWDLWGLLDAYQSDRTIPRLPGTSVKLSDFGPVGGGSASGLTPGQRQQLRQAVTAGLQNPSLVCELPVLGHQRCRSELSRALQLARQGERTPVEALEEASRDWSATIDELGPARVLDGYRRRLGLSPLSE